MSLPRKLPTLPKREVPPFLKEFRKIEQELDEIIPQIASLRDKLAEIRRQIRILKIQRQNLLEIVQKLRNINDSIVKMVPEDKVKTYIESLSEVEKILSSDLENERVEYRDTLVKLRGFLGELVKVQQNPEVQEYSNMLKDFIDKLNQTLTSLYTSLDQASNVEKTLRDLVAKIRDNIRRRLEDKICNVDEDLLQDLKEDLQADLEDIEDEMKNVKDELISLIGRLNELRSRRREFVSRIRELKAQRREYYTQLKKLRGTLKKLREELVNMYKSLRTGRVQVGYLRNLIRDIDSIERVERRLMELEWYQQTHPLSLEEEKRIVQEILILFNKLLAVKRYQETITELEKQKQQIAECKQKIRSLTDEISTLLEKIRSCTEQIRILGVEIDNLKDEIGKIVSKISETKNKLNRLYMRRMFIREVLRLIKAEERRRRESRQLMERARRIIGKIEELKRKAEEIEERFKKGEEISLAELQILLKAGFRLREETK